MGDLIKGDLVRHARYGIGRVEEASGYGENQRCMVYFPRSEKETSVAREQIQTLSETESAAYEMVKLAIDEIRGEELPQVELMDRWAEFISKGFVTEEEAYGLFSELKLLVLKLLGEMNQEVKSEWIVVEGMVKKTLGKFIYKQIERRPMIIPIILEL